MITIPKTTDETPSGAFGVYFKLREGKGIKVLEAKFRSQVAAYNSYEFDLAKEEAEILKAAQESGVVPKCYGVRIVRRGNGFHVGILMQHLGNKTLRKLRYNWEKQSDIYDSLNDALEDVGVKHNDLHVDNIMYYRGKYYAIDFSPEVSSIE